MHRASGVRSEEGGSRLRRLWHQNLHLRDLRNDVLHAGFNKSWKSSESIMTETREIVDELHKIARLWNLIED